MVLNRLARLPERLSRSGMSTPPLSLSLLYPLTGQPSPLVTSTTVLLSSPANHRHHTHQSSRTAPLSPLRPPHSPYRAAASRQLPGCCAGPLAARRAGPLVVLVGDARWGSRPEWGGLGGGTADGGRKCADRRGMSVRTLEDVEQD